MSEVIKINEISKIREIIENYKEDLPLLQEGEIFRETLAQKFFNKGSMLVFVENEKEIGFASFYHNNLCTKEGYLSLIAVKEQYRGQGIAQKIFDAVRLEMVKSGMESIKLEVRKENYRAKSFYIKNGFKISETRDKIFIMTRVI